MQYQTVSRGFLDTSCIYPFDFRREIGILSTPKFTDTMKCLEAQVLCWKLSNTRSSYFCSSFLLQSHILIYSKRVLKKTGLSQRNWNNPLSLVWPTTMQFKMCYILTCITEMLEKINLKKSSDGKIIIYPQVANFLVIIAICFRKELRMSTYTLKNLCVERWCLSISSSPLLICIFST